MSSRPKVPRLVERVDREGKPGLAYNFHDGQIRAWRSEKRVVAVIAGARGGKTSFAPLWLHREMIRRGPGDYLIAAPSYQIIDKAAGPEVESFFGRTLGLGSLVGRPVQFPITRRGHSLLWPGVPYERPSRIIFGHADDPDSLEAMTAKAAWIDEAGQRRFRLGSFEAIQRRLSLDEGRLLITTTPYDLGWLKQQIYDPWVEAKRNHPEIEVVNFDSTANPAFPREEFDRAFRNLPLWRFNMFYRGIFERPAGLIYDSFNRKDHVRHPYTIPPEWPRYAGLDFGATNTAAVYFAAELGDNRLPTGRLIAYREEKPGKLPPETIAKKLREGEPASITFVGGNPQEEEWRSRFRAAGLAVQEPPFRDVEVGIDTVHGCFARGEVVVFSTLKGMLDELESYSREVDEAGEPTEKIDGKQFYHRLDAVRYVLSWLKRSGIGPFAPSRDPSGGSAVLQAPPGVFEQDQRRDDDRERRRRKGEVVTGGMFDGFPEW